MSLVQTLVLVLLAFDCVFCQFLNHTCWSRPLTSQKRKWLDTDSAEYKEYLRNAFRPPISAGPDNTAAVAGTRVSFHCKSDTVATLNWYFRPFNTTLPFTEVVTDCSVNEPYTDKYELENPSFGQCDLVLKSAEADDAGTFICKQQTLDPPGRSAELVVFGSVPSCDSNVEGDYVMPGQQIRLTCTATYTGLLPPDMTWTDEQGSFLPSSSITSPTSIRSFITVVASRPSVGLYNCATHFNNPSVVPPEVDVDPATNIPDYRHLWTSVRLLVEPGQDCADIKTRIPESTSGVYSIVIREESAVVQVYCDMSTSGGGWTVFQRRQDGSQDFYLSWDSYAAGFGSLTGEFWLGNEHLVALTALQSTNVRFDLGDWEGNYRYAEYEDFVVAPASNNYTLSLGAYSGDAGDSMSPHTGFNWTTFDRDNDINVTLNCAEVRHGAWWYRSCGFANLNSEYNGTCLPFYSCMFWCDWLGDEYALRFTEIKLRPTDF
jgi:ficolin